MVDSWRRWRGRGRMRKERQGMGCVSGGGTFFWGYVLDMRQPLLEHRAQGLFDVEIGQFESVSFNFSQLTGPPWVPHIPLIGYKLVFLSSHSPGFETPLFSSPFYTLLRYPRCCFSLSLSLPSPPSSSSFSVERSCSLTPDVCQSVISIKLHLGCL